MTLLIETAKTLTIYLILSLIMNLVTLILIYKAPLTDINLGTRIVATIGMVWFLTALFILLAAW